MRALRALARILLLATIVSGCATARWPRLVSVPDPDLRPAFRLDAIFDYGTAVTTIAAIFERDLGFPRFPVTFQFHRNREAFEAALVAVGYPLALARSTASTMSAVGGHRGVLLNDAALGSVSWPERIALLAHEMGHSLQYELGGGGRGTSDQWLREGFAEWVSIRVLERLDAVSMFDARRARLRELAVAGRSKTPRLSDLVTFPQWVKVGRQHGSVTYAFAFIAVDRLLERHGVAAVLAYFRRFASSMDRAGNFRAAFGEDLETFETALVAHVWRR